MPPGLETFLAFDYGRKRTGVASGNRLTRTATPQGSVQALGRARWPLLRAWIKRWEPDALVVGIPFHPDGAAHENTRRAKRFGRQLGGRFSLPVYEVDERYSTTEALAAGAPDDDAVAAAIILQQFLRDLP